MDVHNSSIHTFKTFSKGSSIGEWINKWQHIHYKEYNSAIKICLLVNVKGMNYNSIMPSKRQNSLQNSSYVVIHLCDLLEQANML